MATINIPTYTGVIGNLTVNGVLTSGRISTGSNSNLTANTITGQGINCVAIGGAAGNQFQGTGAVAVGTISGQSNQSANAVAIGANAGNLAQAVNSVAIVVSSILLL